MAHKFADSCFWEIKIKIICGEFAHMHTPPPRRIAAAASALGEELYLGYR